MADDLLMKAEDYTSPDVKSKIIPSFWESNAIDGTVWALPILASCRSLFCNMDLLNEAGITAPPTTWDEVLTACEAVKAKHGDSVVPWGLDISTDEGQAAFSYYSWNFGGGYLDASGNWALNSAENVKAVEYIKQLIDSGYCNSAPYTDTRYPLQDAFSAGTLAMMIGPMNMVSADSTVNYQSVNIPGKGATPTTWSTRASCPPPATPPTTWPPTRRSTRWAAPMPPATASTSRPSAPSSPPASSIP